MVKNNKKIDVSLEVYPDAALLRFLRARKFDIPKTEKMFFDFLKWREEMGVDKLPTVFYYYYHFYHNHYRNMYFQKLMSLKNFIPMVTIKQIKW